VAGLSIDAPRDVACLVKVPMFAVSPTLDHEVIYSWSNVYAMTTRIITAADVRDYESRLAPQPMIGLEFEFPSGGGVELHAHPYGQIVFGGEGIMCVETPRGAWVVPPHRAVWVPAFTPHEVRLRSSFAMHNLLIAPHHASGLPGRCEPLAVSGLMRELILRVADSHASVRRSGRIDSYLELIRDEFTLADEQPLALALPRDRRLARLCTQLLREPANNRSLEEWGELVGASARTLSRLFRQQLHMTFDEWRRHVRLREALHRLAEGRSVSSVANELGYDNASAFIEMFRKALGRTPGQYFSM
jgi:AraC-like DNA-binding protein/quercetin dioxygenase-like cupin family protein